MLCKSFNAVLRKCTYDAFVVAEFCIPVFMTLWWDCKTGDAKSIASDEQYPLHSHMSERSFSFPQPKPEMSTVPISIGPGVNHSLSTLPFPPSHPYTPKDLDLHRKGRRTSREEIMMFMMSPNVESAQATKSLSVVAISCRRAFSGLRRSYMGLCWPPLNPAHFSPSLSFKFIFNYCCSRVWWHNAREGQPCPSPRPCNIHHKCHKKQPLV